MEERLSIAPWPVAPNENNDILRRGCEKLGIPAAAIRRNVRGCWNLGYCGMGCPTNAKQSMLVTTIPSALGPGRHARASRPRRAARRLGRPDHGRRGARTRPLRRAARAAPPAHRGAARGPGLGRHRHARGAAAQRPSGSERARGPADLPASDRGVGGPDAEPRPGLRRRAADDLLRPFPRFGPRRRSRGLQAGSAAAAPHPRGDHPAGLRGGPRALDEGIRQPPGRHRAASRRLPPALDRRARAAARRRLARAGLSARRLPLGGHAPGLSHDGRDPVRRGRRHGDGLARGRRPDVELGARRRPPSRRCPWRRCGRAS